MQEVAETMEKQNLKEESIEFYNQVIHIIPHEQGIITVSKCLTACCRLSCMVMKQSISINAIRSSTHAGS